MTWSGQAEFWGQASVGFLSGGSAEEGARMRLHGGVRSRAPACAVRNVPAPRNLELGPDGCKARAGEGKRQTGNGGLDVVLLGCYPSRGICNTWHPCA